MAADTTELRTWVEQLGPRVEWVAAPPAGGWADALGLLGAHNLRNAEIARVCLEALGEAAAADPAALADLATGFTPLPSRLTVVATLDGVDFVDDSLSTNVLPTVAAVEAFADRPVALLVGGFDRGIDYAPARRAAAGPHRAHRRLHPARQRPPDRRGPPARGHRRARGRGHPRGHRGGVRLGPAGRGRAAVAGRAELRPLPRLPRPGRGLRRRRPGLPVVNCRSVAVTSVDRVSDLSTADIATATPGALFSMPHLWADMDAWHERVAELRRTEGDACGSTSPATRRSRCSLRHADVFEVSRHNAAVGQHVRSRCSAPTSTMEQLLASGMPIPASLVQLDGDDHRVHRQVANDWFKPAVVGKRQPRIDELADQFVQRMRDLGGECDFAKDIAAALHAPRDHGHLRRARGGRAADARAHPGHLRLGRSRVHRRRRERRGPDDRRRS